MIPYLDKTIVKITLVLAILTLLVGFAKWSYDSVFQAGVTHQIAEQAELNKIADEAYTDSINEALQGKKNANIEAARLLQELNNVEGKFREIQKATANSKCKSLGAESFKLFNDIIGPEPSY